MSHDERFAALQARKREQERNAVTVTWRKVSPLTGGGYSGLGPGGQLVYAVKREMPAVLWEFGRVVGGKRVVSSYRPTLAQAKRDAAELLRKGATDAGAA